jgi:hypothetical protein
MFSDMKGLVLAASACSQPPSEKHYTRYPHRLGWAVLHLGAQWHRAMPIQRGRRTNIIMWLRSTEYTAKHGCLMCGKPEVGVDGVEVE